MTVVIRHIRKRIRKLEKQSEKSEQTIILIARIFKLFIELAESIENKNPPKN